MSTLAQFLFLIGVLSVIMHYAAPALPAVS